MPPEIVVISSDDLPPSPGIGPGPVPVDRSICVISSSPLAADPAQSKPTTSILHRQDRFTSILSDPSRSEDIGTIPLSHIASSNKGYGKRNLGTKGKAKVRYTVSSSPPLPVLPSRSSSFGHHDTTENGSCSIDHNQGPAIAGEAAAIHFNRAASAVSDLSSEFEEIRLLTHKTITTGRNDPLKEKVSKYATAQGFSATSATTLAKLGKGITQDDWNTSLLDDKKGVPRFGVPETMRAMGDSKSMRKRKKRPSDGHEERNENDKPSINSKRKKVDIDGNRGNYKPTSTEKERKKREKEAEKERKRVQVETEKEMKRREKEAKTLKRQLEQELVAVNKLHSRKESVAEMIVDISHAFSKTPAGLQLIRFLEAQGCQIRTDWESPVPNVVKWRRKVRAEWSQELGHFVPISEVIKSEKHILVVVKAEEFVEFSIEQTKLDEHINQLRTILVTDCSEVKLIYMIEGLASLIRKSRNAKSRSFQGAVRNAMAEVDAAGPVNSRGRVRRRAIEAIDENTIEDALLSLQILHGCLIHHTANTTETSEWISILTADISTIPYKLSRMNYSTSFCTDIGQVKTGADAPDTYLKMLQEVNRVTVGVANGIIAEYPTVKSLIRGFKKNGEAALAEVDIIAGSNPTGRVIGHAMSKRIYKIFMAEEPDCTDL